MPPPYNGKMRLKLDSLVTAKRDAPKSWLSYPIYIRGEAETLKEARQKMQKIIRQTQSYAYSTDNDEHAKERSTRSIKFFEGKAKMNREEAIEKIMYGSDNERSRNSSHEYSSSVTC
ncbi:PREDICTED: uncharacterized protein LOC105556179 [Vollenhovia emeryi]|uniref:uncharacterized protein LOC105556179 n=1 Tax=Vollenhovia emeryi TaxID=411798 RepID=UPI0005F565C0|nr:PREDICTED: uncharacterized protein LOC105556179 [Vollenhovia emeryi]